MSQQEIKASVEKILENSHVGPMATVKNNKPHSRYMTFYHKDMKLYTPTSTDTDKTEEIEANPYTHILLGYEGEGFGDEYVEYQGKVSLNQSNDLKKQLWNEELNMYFDGPDDPSLVIMEIEPVQVRLMNKKGEPPKDLEF
ncbi:pyridoxamine 5'-phosphate oxidase family protein [Lentibacillus sediminis]|uniref:pyridoxamine 5'-phosphate oxidase family protein n=1 Tax=Lentibacillus sediminis TaxID=1940529 RepID=UPI000C1B8436|nr:pyridoxamine 5'-phosphate oxidase family protein [Lentibacillus sediminis]